MTQEQRDEIVVRVFNEAIKSLDIEGDVEPIKDADGRLYYRLETPLLIGSLCWHIITIIECYWSSGENAVKCVSNNRGDCKHWHNGHKVWLTATEYIEAEAMDTRRGDNG